MPHVSKYKLQKEVAESISKEFIKVLLQLKYRDADSRFLAEFFTDTERTMLAKRLAIAALLLRGMPPYRIQVTLGVSPSTIARIQLQFELGKLKEVERALRKTLGLKGFWEKLETLLQAGFPSRGKGRWKFLKDDLRPE